MQLKNKYFIEAVGLFKDGTKEKTQIPELIILLIHELINRNIAPTMKGYHFHVSKEYRKIQHVIPGNPPEDEFEILYSLCRMAHICKVESNSVSNKTSQFFTLSERKHFIEEAELLGDAAHDIIGNSYHLMYQR